jgi:hypothetical protein
MYNAGVVVVNPKIRTYNAKTYNTTSSFVLLKIKKYQRQLGTVVIEFQRNVCIIFLLFK